MSSWGRRGAFVGAGLIVLAQPRGALAQTAARTVSAEDGALAETLFRDGRALLEAGKIDAACTKLEGSQKLDPKVGTLLNVAACHELQGRTASAWAEFLEAARLARVVPVRDPRALEQTARARAEALAPRIHTLALEHPETLPNDVDILLDGRPIPRIAWSTPIPVDPGERVLTAQAPGKVSWRGVVLVDGRPSIHSVSVPELVVVVAESPPPSPSGGLGDLEEPRRVTSAPFLVGAGVAAVGVGLGSALGLSALSLKKQRDRECDPTGCSSEGLAKQDDARTAATGSTIAFAVGGVGAAFAIYWLVRPSRSSPATTPSRGVARETPLLGACGPRGCSVEWRGSF